MSRPLGLTALAVINILLSLATAGVVGLELEHQIQMGTFTSQALIPFGVGALVAVLLFVAAIGYLRQRRVLGRYVGSAYAVLSLVISAVVAIRSGIAPAVIVALIYPLVTLLVLNVNFKLDLVH